MKYGMQVEDLATALSAPSALNVPNTLEAAQCVGFLFEFATSSAAEQWKREMGGKIEDEGRDECSHKSTRVARKTRRASPPGLS